MSAYLSLLQRIYTMESARPRGFQKVLHLSESLGSLHRNFKILHVAGTNGKGSVTLKCAKSLEISGFKTGMYTSPHLFDFCERIQVNSQKISQDFVVEGLSRILQIAEQEDIQVGFVDVTVTLSLLYFTQQNVDVAVIEVGCGGLTDQTNLVTPDVSIITSIGMDHAHILGNTLEAITYQKAGIIKPGVPCVIGPKVPVEVVQKVAQEKNAPLYVIPCANGYETYDEENTRTSRKALEIFQERNPQLTTEAILQGTSMRPLCRFMEYQGLGSNGKLSVLIDVAHNKEAFEHLFSDILHKYSCPITAIVGVSANKDVKGILQVVSANVKTVHFVTNDYHRLATTSQLQKHAQELQISNIGQSGPTAEVLASVIADFPPDELLVICGSFFIMEEVRSVLSFLQ